MPKSSTQIENILPLDDLKECMVNCFDTIGLLENHKNDFLIPSADKKNVQKIEYQFSKCKEQLHHTLKGFYDLIEIISIVNQATEDNSKILSQINKKIEQCSNEDKKNYRLVFDASQKLYNVSIIQLTGPCFNFFTDFSNINLNAQQLQDFLNQLEIINKLCEKYDLILSELAKDIAVTLSKTKDIIEIVTLLKKNILKT